MNHHSHETSASETVATTGLTRRQLLARSAAIGGGVLAAQSLGTVTAFAQTSAPPPTEQPTDTATPPDETETPTVKPTSATEPTESSTDATAGPTTSTLPSTPTSGSTTPSTGSSGSGPTPPAGSSGRVGTGSTTRLATQSATSSTELAHTGIDTPYLLAAGVGGIAAGAAMVKRTANATGPDQATPVFDLDDDSASSEDAPED